MDLEQNDNKNYFVSNAVEADKVITTVLKIFIRKQGRLKINNLGFPFHKKRN